MIRLPVGAATTMSLCHHSIQVLPRLSDVSEGHAFLRLSWQTLTPRLMVNPYQGDS